MYELAGGGGGGKLAGLYLHLLCCLAVSTTQTDAASCRCRAGAACRCRTAGALVALTGWLTAKLGPGMEVEFACDRAEPLPALPATSALEVLGGHSRGEEGRVVSDDARLQWRSTRIPCLWCPSFRLQVQGCPGKVPQLLQQLAQQGDGTTGRGLAAASCRQGSDVAGLAPESWFLK